MSLKQIFQGREPGQFEGEVVSGVGQGKPLLVEKCELKPNGVLKLTLLHHKGAMGAASTNFTFTLQEGAVAAEGKWFELPFFTGGASLRLEGDTVHLNWRAAFGLGSSNYLWKLRVKE